MHAAQGWIGGFVFLSLSPCVSCEAPPPKKKPPLTCKSVTDYSNELTKATYIFIQPITDGLQCQVDRNENSFLKNKEGDPHKTELFAFIVPVF
jgi:hypothetical protein